MRKLWLAIALFSAWAPAFAQLETDTISVTASRQLNVPPDQAAFNVAVQSGADALLDQVVSTLNGTGITPANLSNVYSSSDGTLQWGFTLAAPFSKIGNTIGILSSLQAKSIGRQGQPAITYSIQGLQVSPERQASTTCSTSDLISDAQAQAQRLAGAAGFTVGPVLSLSDGSGAQVATGVAYYAIATTVVLNGRFTASISAPINCSAVVKFKLIRYH